VHRKRRERGAENDRDAEGIDEVANEEGVPLTSRLRGSVMSSPSGFRKGEGGKAPTKDEFDVRYMPTGVNFN